MGIRREDKSEWERRVVLVPEHVSEIMKKNSNIKFIVQPCDKRNFSDSEYQDVGAEISEDLSHCDLILGVKEVPIEKLYPNKTYMFFSHTIKAQEANMPTLDHILANNIRLIDYEKITNEKGTRLVAFGRFAGIAGAIDFLSGLGHFLVQMGIVTPLLYVAPSYKYFSLKEAFELIKRIGYVIRDEEIPEKLQPLIFAITGKGRCSQGAFEVLKNLPHKIIHPEEMEDLVKNKTNPQHKKLIYITFLESQHMVRNKLSKNFDKQEYYSHPDRFEPIFHEKYLPYISAIFHNMYWDQRFPRLITS